MLALTLVFVLGAAPPGGSADCPYKAVPGKSLGPRVLGMPLAEAERLGARPKDNEYELGDGIRFELDPNDRVSRIWAGSSQVCADVPSPATLDLNSPSSRRARPYPDCRWDRTSWTLPAWFCPAEGLWYRAAERLENGETSSGYVGVFWPKGKAPKPSGAFSHLGSFSDMRYTEEHQYGTSAHLYLRNGTLVGILEVSEGLQGDTPSGVLEETRYDAATGAVAFSAKLTTGSHYCHVHNGEPSQDLFSFEGTLAKGALTGKLRHRNMLHPEAEGEVSPVKLPRAKGAPSTLGPRGFDRMLERLRQSGRGPKW